MKIIQWLRVLRLIDGHSSDTRMILYIYICIFIIIVNIAGKETMNDLISSNNNCGVIIAHKSYS